MSGATTACLGVDKSRLNRLWWRRSGHQTTFSNIEFVDLGTKRECLEFLTEAKLDRIPFVAPLFMISPLIRPNYNYGRSKFMLIIWVMFIIFLLFVNSSLVIVSGSNLVWYIVTLPEAIATFYSLRM